MLAAVASRCDTFSTETARQPLLQWWRACFTNNTHTHIRTHTRTSCEFTASCTVASHVNYTASIQRECFIDFHADISHRICNLHTHADK